MPGRLGIAPLARVVSSAVYAIDPLIMGLAPAWAIPLALRRAGLTPDRVGVWEVHEAFSAQALGVLRELPNQMGGFTIPDDNLNPNGVAVATGHPFGASGTRYVLTLATELRGCARPVVVWVPGDPKAAQIERLRASVDKLKTLLAQANTRIDQLTDFRIQALARLAAQHEEILRLRGAADPKTNVAHLHATRPH